MTVLLNVLDKLIARAGGGEIRADVDVRRELEDAMKRVGMVTESETDDDEAVRDSFQLEQDRQQDVPTDDEQQNRQGE